MVTDRGGFGVFAHKKIQQSTVVTVGIYPPTKAGQIPVSELDQTNGELVYTPIDDLITPVLKDPANVGKGIFIGQNGVPYAENVVLGSEVTDSLLDTTGVIGRPDITIVNANTIRIGTFTAVIFGIFTGSRLVFDVVATDVRIPNANTNDRTKDITFVYMEDTRTILTTDVVPTDVDRIEKIYLCEVSHPDGGPIDSIRLLYTPIDNLMYNSLKLADIIGVKARNFVFSFDRTAGSISQTSSSAHLNGVMIEASGVDKNTKTFLAGAITVRYLSFDPTKTVPALADWRQSYFIDNPSNNTSTALTSDQRGIIVVYASINGTYTAIAPQKMFINFQSAEVGRELYLREIRLPADFDKFYAPVATIIVAGAVTVTAVTNDFVISLVGDVALSGNSFVSQSNLPDPSIGTAGSFVVVNTAGTAFVFKSDVTPDLSSASNGDVLVVESGKLVARAPATVNISVDAELKLYVDRIATFTISGFGPLLNTGNAYADLGQVTITTNQIRVANDRAIFGVATVVNTTNPDDFASSIMLYNTVGVSGASRYSSFNFPSSINLRSNSWRVVIRFRLSP